MDLRCLSLHSHVVAGAKRAAGIRRLVFEEGLTGMKELLHLINLLWFPSEWFTLYRCLIEKSCSIDLDWLQERPDCSLES